MTSQGESLDSRLMRCWGKTGATPDEFHPAVFHMFDVGQVARELLSERASPRWRRILAATLVADADTLVHWLPWVVAMHDIGKVSATFQGQNPEQKSRLRAEGFEFGQSNLETHHTLVGWAAAGQQLRAACGVPIPDALWRVCRETMAGHHGRFATPMALAAARQELAAYEPACWATLRASAAGRLQGRLLRDVSGEWPWPDNTSAAIAAVCGFTILCDWIGSNSEYFRAEPGMGLDEYIDISTHRARQAVEAAGFFQTTLSRAPSNFSALFPDLLPPRPLQEAINAIPAAFLTGPCLAIIEAPTGEGKTEAALTLAHRLAESSGSDEMYYALPTTATSNQMFGRLQRHVRDGLGLPVRTKLIHGQAFLVEDDLRIERMNSGDSEDSAAALEWFGPKKRALMAPFGVGTIDQAELAALNVRHSLLRMVGLAGKVIIVDEVHAYDTYMTTIVERLLNWLSVMGTSVVVLSATLPQGRRAALLRAYGGPGVEALEKRAEYPSLWLVSQAGSYHARPPAQQPDRRIALHFLSLGEDDELAKARWLLDAVADGGCGCWITNTVRRAQRLYQALQDIAPSDLDVMVLHAQFPLDDRQRLEKRLAAQYGLNGRRPNRGIVVGTQVLEQSLDLDFDVMVSDLAPVDLLLQRAGRLHRHNRPRPPQHDSPRLWVNAARAPDGNPSLTIDRWVYAEFILRQTWQALQGRTVIHLPADYRTLVEAVYDAAEPPCDSPLRQAWDRLQNEKVDAAQKAEQRLLPLPDPEDSFCGAASQLQFEEGESGAAWIVAQTRLGDDSVTVVPMVKTGTKACLYPEGEEVNLDDAAPRQVQLALLRRSLRMSQQDVVRAMRAEQSNLRRLFTDSALLRGCFPLWLSDGRYELDTVRGRLSLTLDPVLGLVITREARHGQDD